MLEDFLYETGALVCLGIALNAQFAELEKIIPLQHLVWFYILLLKQSVYLQSHPRSTEGYSTLINTELETSNRKITKAMHFAV